MKTILVPTDFTKSSENVGRYALLFAKHLKANLNLCHAFLVPADAPMAAQAAWPLYEYAALKEGTARQLEAFTKELKTKDSLLSGTDSFHPLITYTSEAGPVTDVVTKIAEDKHTYMIVMGMKGANAFSRFLLGSSSLRMIEKTEVPLLLIPTDFIFRDIRKIAFATDLNAGDIEVIHSLAGFARLFDADLVVAHVTDKQNDSAHEKKADSFLNDITCKINYDKIYYRHIKHENTDKGLDWLGEHGLIDLLVMVHHHKNFIGRILDGSHTQREAEHIRIPLLVLPAGLHPVF